MALDLGIDYTSILNIGITGALIVLSLFFILVIGGVAAYFYYMKVFRYKQYTIIVWRKDPMSGNIVEDRDMGGVFLDKASDIKGLWLKKMRVVLNPDNIPYVISGKHRIVYVLQTGYKNFRYIKPSVTDDKLKFNLGEEDVNWGIYEYKQSHSQYILEHDWKQWIPYVGMFLMAFLIIFITIMLLKKFDVLAEIANKLDHAAMVISKVV